MKPSPRLLPLLLTTLFGVTSAADLVADPPHVCEPCDHWAKPREPFNVFGNTWYVGGGLSSILITSDKGHVLIDGGLPQSAPTIAANIRKLGFRLEDVKLILNSHMHYDHAGGIAALQRASGAQVAASPAGKRALENGGPLEDDPQFAFGPKHNNFPAVANVREVADGETLKAAGIEITAHLTPGHTPGGTSWSWKSCAGSDCRNVVYADSLNSVSAPGFRFSGGEKYPSRVPEFEKSIEKVASLPCDILLAPHPELIDLDAKLAALAKDARRNVFIGDGQDCKRYASGARERLAKRVSEER
jgi:metallo-beta-lactamase class B